MKSKVENGEVIEEFRKWFNHGTKKEPRFAYASLVFFEVEAFIQDALNQQRVSLINKIREELDKEAVDLIPYNADESHLSRLKEFLTKLEK